MNRRQFLGSLAIGSVAHSVPAPKKLAITMDDPHTAETPLMSPTERNDAILAALQQAGLRATLFVCGKRIDDVVGNEILSQWNDAGHVLANHTYSHPYLASKDVSLPFYLDDILRGQEIIEPFSRFQGLFRFPFLKEGDTLEKRDGVRAFLDERGYRVGHVTIDASDWYVDGRMRERLSQDPSADVSPYREFYLRHLWERASFYDELALEVVGRPVKHTLLIHHSLLNALFLSDVLRMFESRGWEWIDGAEAFRDDIFSEAPDILPAGESLIWALAKQGGGHESVLRYPGEDSVYEKDAMDRLGL